MGEPSRIDVLAHPCRMCHAKPYHHCVSYGTADRDNDYRQMNPHRLRRNDAWRELNPRLFLAFVGTQTLTVRTSTKTQAVALVIQRYADRGYRVRKSEIKVRRATVDDAGWMRDAGEPLLADEIERAFA